LGEEVAVLDRIFIFFYSVIYCLNGIVLSFSGFGLVWLLQSSVNVFNVFASSSFDGGGVVGAVVVVDGDVCIFWSCGFIG